MRWRSTSGDWKKVFLLIPHCIEGTWYWLEWCWRRDEGDCTAYVFEEPKCHACGGGSVFCRHCMDKE